VRRKARRKARRSVTCVDDNAPFGALMNLRNDVSMLMSCWTFQATLAGSSELEVRGGRVGCWQPHWAAFPPALPAYEYNHGIYRVTQMRGLSLSALRE
jgi:hypothetical protein